jgi:type IV secretion system protein VirD4
LWCPWDRTAGVIGPQGSGKTLDLLTPALIDAPGAALVTLTKPDDLLLSLPERSKDGRRCVVLDPFGLVPGLPELVWDPIAGCVDRMVAERRAKAFTAGTIHGSSHGSGDAAARFYAAEAAKVLMAYFHAAALTGKTLDELLAWVARPLATSQPEEILRRHPHSDPLWAAAHWRAARGRADEREHHHHGPAGHVAVLPGRHPPPVCAVGAASGHPCGRHRPGTGDHLPAGA